MLPLERRSGVSPASASEVWGKPVGDKTPQLSKLKKQDTLWGALGKDYRPEQDGRHARERLGLGAHFLRAVGVGGA